LPVADSEPEWEPACGLVEAVGELDPPVGGGAWCADRLPRSEVVDEHFYNNAVCRESTEDVSFELDGPGGGGASWRDPELQACGDALKDLGLRHIRSAFRGWVCPDLCVFGVICRSAVGGP